MDRVVARRLYVPPLFYGFLVEWPQTVSLEMLSVLQYRTFSLMVWLHLCFRHNAFLTMCVPDNLVISLLHYASLTGRAQQVLPTATGASMSRSRWISLLMVCIQTGLWLMMRERVVSINCWQVHARRSRLKRRRQRPCCIRNMQLQQSCWTRLSNLGPFLACTSASESLVRSSVYFIRHRWGFRRFIGVDTPHPAFLDPSIITAVS